MKKLIAVLICAATALTLASCVKPLDEASARAVAERLLTDSVEVNEIYFGYGLAADASELEAKTNELTASIKYPFYVRLAEDAKYRTIDEIKAAARRVYSAEYCEFLYTLAFTGISEDEEMASVPKYFIGDDGELTVRVNSPEEGEIMPVTRTFLTDTIEFVKIGREYFIFKVQSALGGEPDAWLTVTAVREKLPDEMNYGWYLDTPTY